LILDRLAGKAADPQVHWIEPEQIVRESSGAGAGRGVGRSIAKELMRRRVQHAQPLLRETDLKVHAVAQESGFGSMLHLVRGFRRTTGMKCGEYRRLARSVPPA
jgi:hypothetical protein